MKANTPESKATKSIWPVVLLIAVSIPAYIWMATNGTWRHLNDYTNYNAQLADGFLHRRLSLAAQPSPALLNLPDPYDPVANEKWRAPDLSLYKGKYFMYWGPAPAAIFAGVCWIFGINHPNGGDGRFGIVFAFGTALFAAILILQIRSRFFDHRPVSGAGLAIFSLAFSAPVFFSIASCNIYETAIFAGQFFLLGGLCAAWFAFRDGGARPLLLAVAGACWVLSIASRVSLPPAVSALALIALLQIRRAGSRTPKLRAAAALLLPMAAGAVLIGWYDYARFDSVLETGATYQLSGHVQTSLFSQGFVSLHHIAPNLAAYLLNLPGKTLFFPYLQSVVSWQWLGKFFTLWPDYHAEPVTGLVWTQAFLAFAPIALLGRRPRIGAPESSDGELPGWLGSSLWAGGVLGFLPSLMMNGVAMRYLVDGLPCLGILAAIGYWQTLDALADRPRWAHEVRMAARVIVPLQCILGLLLGVSRNPALFLAVQRLLPLW